MDDEVLPPTTTEMPVASSTKMLNAKIDLKSIFKILSFLTPKNFKEFFDLKKFEKPNNCSDSFRRLTENINYFIGNYLIIIVLHILVICFGEKMLLLLVPQYSYLSFTIITILMLFHSGINFTTIRSVLQHSIEVIVVVFNKIRKFKLVKEKENKCCEETNDVSIIEEEKPLVPVEPPVWSLDICFIIDCSSNMSAKVENKTCFNEAQTRIQYILNNLGNQLYSKFPQVKLTINYSLMSLKEACMYMQKSGLSDNVSDCERFLFSLNTYERPLSTVDIVNTFKMAFNERVDSSKKLNHFVFLSNEPYYNGDVKPIEEMMQQFAQNKIEFTFVKFIENNNNFDTTLKYMYDCYRANCSPMSIIKLVNSRIERRENITNIQQAIPSKRRHFIFMLDESGSMGGQPWQDLMNAYNGFLDTKLRDYSSDLVSLLTHNHDSIIHFQAFDVNSARRYNVPFRSGGNDFNIAFTTAENLISKASDVIPIMVFMSDGEDRDPSNIVSNLMTKYAHMGLKVYTIGFGSGCNNTILQNIAKVGGTSDVMKALSFAELNQAFQNIIKKELTEVVIHEFIRDDHIIAEDILQKFNNRFSNEIADEVNKISCQRLEEPKFDVSCDRYEPCGSEECMETPLKFRSKRERSCDDENLSFERIENDCVIKEHNGKLDRISILARLLVILSNLEQYLVPVIFIVSSYFGCLFILYITVLFIFYASDKSYKFIFKTFKSELRSWFNFLSGDFKQKSIEINSEIEEREFSENGSHKINEKESMSVYDRIQYFKYNYLVIYIIVGLYFCLFKLLQFIMDLNLQSYSIIYTFMFILFHGIYYTYEHYVNKEVSELGKDSIDCSEHVVRKIISIETKKYEMCAEINNNEILKQY